MNTILSGRNPIAEDTIKLKAQRYVMIHRGFGHKHEEAYIAGAMDILAELTKINAL